MKKEIKPITKKQMGIFLFGLSIILLVLPFLRDQSGQSDYNGMGEIQTIVFRVGLAMFFISLPLLKLGNKPA